ncbi:MAG: hypothetical protein NTV97_03470 [Alphaproteobacteria bacterium]|nr:hypothetical protein [Alphaproteobacteria bacterium]
MSKSPFVFRKFYPFTWTVKVPEGVVPAFEFRARFESVSQSELDALVAKNPTRSDEAIALAVFKGWVEGDLVGEDGQPLHPTESNIKAIVDQSWLRTPIVGAFLQAMSGLAAKN